MTIFQLIGLGIALLCIVHGLGKRLASLGSAYKR